MTVWPSNVPLLSKASTAEFPLNRSKRTNERPAPSTAIAAGPAEGVDVPARGEREVDARVHIEREHAVPQEIPGGGEFRDEPSLFERAQILLVARDEDVPGPVDDDGGRAFVIVRAPRMAVRNRSRDRQERQDGNGDDRYDRDPGRESVTQAWPPSCDTSPVAVLMFPTW